tara:strand:- start:82 stop:258 length:177 start_codon:yes stop_codon:yes gene_type:complete
MNDNQWVITVNDKGDKVNSHIVHGETESQARQEAVEWINKIYGDYSDWTLHKIVEAKK